MDTINSNVLTPNPQIPYVAVNQVPIPSVSGLDNTTQLAPTSAETQANDITTQLQNLNNELVGKSAYQTSQETAQGVPDLVKTQNDLSAQLKGLQNEAQAIPLQLQQDVAGRGVTAGGLTPIQTGKLRENAIKALTISSLLEANKGNLATAQDLADRAVAAKYDPVTEQINAAKANLQLILNSPDYTIQEKNRAQAQKDIQDQKQAEVDKQKADQTNIYNTAVTAAKNGADSVTLQNIMKATTPLEAIQIAGGYMGTPKTPPIDTSVDYTKANQFIQDNPDASDAELKNALLQNTKLNSTQINALIDSRGTVLDTPTITSLATSLLGSMNSADALSAVQNGVLNVNGKNITLNETQKQQLVDEINKQNPQTQNNSGGAKWWNPFSWF